MPLVPPSMALGGQYTFGIVCLQQVNAVALGLRSYNRKIKCLQFYKASRIYITCMAMEKEKYQTAWLKTPISWRLHRIHGRVMLLVEKKKGRFYPFPACSTALDATHPAVISRLDSRRKLLHWARNGILASCGTISAASIGARSLR